MRIQSRNLRPLNMAMRDLNEAREKAEFNRMMKEQTCSQIAMELQQAIQAGDNSQTMAIYGRLMQTILQQSDDFDGAPKTAAEMRRNALVNMAYEQANIAIVPSPDGGDMIFCFDTIIERASEIFIAGVHDQVVVTFSDRTPSLTLRGPAASKFIKYLRYLGIFEVAKAKVACKECKGSGGDESNCPDCAGLGWVVEVKDA